MPSPAMATTRPARLQLLDLLHLLLRQNLGDDLIDAKPLRDRFGGLARVSRENDDPDAFGMQRIHRLGRGLLDGSATVSPAATLPSIAAKMLLSASAAGTPPNCSM